MKDTGRGIKLSNVWIECCCRKTSNESWRGDEAQWMAEGKEKRKKNEMEKRKEKYQKTSLVNENFKLSFWQLWIKIIFEKKWLEWGHSSKLKEYGFFIIKKKEII